MPGLSRFAFQFECSKDLQALAFRRGDLLLGLTLQRIGLVVALAARYRGAYARGHQVSEGYRQGLRERFAAVCAEHGVAFGRYYETTDDGSENDEERDDAKIPHSAGSDADAQLGLDFDKSAYPRPPEQ